ncbi:HotDog domain-containing protein [Obelidium mucronatum]|nr:HotDog domain-containing protein [Obelidium mucronatum]
MSDTLLTNKLWVHRFNQRLAQLTKRDPSNATKPVTEKYMQDSFVQVFLAFRTDTHLRDEYSSHFGKIRVGKVLEDLDALAGYISYVHCAGAEKDLALVTASVDRMDLLTNEIPTDRDISLSGHVTYVGKSSMEVTIKLVAILPDSGISKEDMESIKYLRTPLPATSLTGELILSAKFIMVSLDPDSGRASPAPQLILTEADKHLFEQGAQHKSRKQASLQQSLQHTPPTPSELALVHALYIESQQYLEPSPSKLKPAHVIWMKETRFQNLVLTFPQDRNLHNKIFGGHLMRLAFELGYAVGALFSKRPLQFLALDDITFRKPVEIGAVLDLSAQAVYATAEGKVVVKVSAHVVRIVEEGRFLSNEFWFTFQTVGPSDTMNRVLPKSYDECMLYLEGKRRLEGGKTSAN